MKIDPKRLRLYAVTDRAWTHDAEGLLRQVAAAVDGGAGIVQLREKHMGQADFLAEAERFVALCREKGALHSLHRPASENRMGQSAGGGTPRRRPAERAGWAEAAGGEDGPGGGRKANRGRAGANGGGKTAAERNAVRRERDLPVLR